ncbi:nuclear transport factor 2 family protein [Conexibacter stalactiti]|uniref:Nuclear transport factor 2 family protein n=1 Tax=Conexibacter stalactiti TaxID=1940611 RepID=A0ABU4HL02_9ACTN|nr:nuclear transport factor 2 family protein [Conexibacter stalactiti]MDW5594001.1 nuclear transport factor 2 family protein [Conexibacter stalactiti]MEC5034643.1 nuclear transport factor 2 family protein [Conexibacter stalactiti]
MSTTEIATVVDDYIAVWNEADPARRRELIARTWTEQGTYVDPLMAGEGVEGIDAMIAAAQAQFPGHRFELTFGPDAHNDVVRFTWTLIAVESGETAAVGVDFATVAPDGRLAAVTGFLEPAA